MNYRTHTLASIIITIFFWTNSLMYNLGITILAIIAGLLPDIDSPKTFLGRLVKPFNQATTHRGFMHSIWSVILIWAITTIFIPSVTLLVLLSYTGHIVLDMGNPKGIQLLYPLKWKIKGFIKSNTFGELIIQIILIISLFYLLYRLI